MITQLTGGGYSGRRYGSFAGRAEVVVVVTPEANSGGFWFAYDDHISRRDKERRKRKKLEDVAQQLQDKLDRELAIELRKDADERDRLDELKRLTKLAQEHEATIRKTLSEKALIALDRAIKQGNYDALEAFERHLRMAKEEEIFLLQAWRILMEYS